LCLRWTMSFTTTNSLERIASRMCCLQMHRCMRCMR
jgi:hypothetical protein